MFAGTKVVINEKEYTMPAISLGQLRNGVLAKLQDHDKLLEEGRTFEAVSIRGDVILAALKRNYPDIDETEVLDWLDMSNSGTIWLSVLGISGFTSGEAQAAATPAINGTSSPSTEV